MCLGTIDGRRASPSFIFIFVAMEDHACATGALPIAAESQPT